jgi:conjugal transfer mating pair stabilization protein TraN
MSYTYQCQTTHQSGGLVCGGDYICKSGECDDTNGAGSSGFDTAVAKLAGLASAAEDAKTPAVPLRSKPSRGKPCAAVKPLLVSLTAAKTLAGDKAPDWPHVMMKKGYREGESQENHRQRGRAVRSQVLGACIQKSQVYCVFDGKLARIIQEQGRRDQLGVKFGSGDSPNCRGSRSRSCRVSTSTKSTSLTSTRI